MNDQWRQLSVYPSRVSAEIAAGLLRSESIPARVVCDEPVPGLVRGCSLLVPEGMLAQAQAVCSQAPLSDQEWSQYIDDED